MKIIRWAAAVVGVAAALTVAAPAHAEDGHFPGPGWQHQQIGPDLVWQLAEAGGIVDATTVELVKPAGDIGTSLETTDLGLPVAAGDTITVDYALSGGATPAAGAVRLFYYDRPGADTVVEAPAAFVAADADSGTLEITVAADATVGTLGLVYDASNDTTGTVTFTNLTVAGDPVWFVPPVVPCEWDQELAADDDACQPPASPSPAASGGPVGTDSPAPGVGGEQLPVTGSSLLPALLILGGGGLAAGLVLHRLSRSRGVTFRA